jgi:hypothetical protein
MAALLFLHRLLWPILERPLDKLNRVGISKHPRVIMMAGLILILLGVGKLEWLKKALDLIGIG